MAPAVATPASTSIPAARNASAGSGRPGLRVPRSARSFARQAMVSPGPKSGQPVATESASVPVAGAPSSALRATTRRVPFVVSSGPWTTTASMTRGSSDWTAAASAGASGLNLCGTLTQQAPQHQEHQRPSQRSALPKGQRHEGQERDGGRRAPAGDAAGGERVPHGKGHGPGDGRTAVFGPWERAVVPWESAGASARFRPCPPPVSSPVAPGSSGHPWRARSSLAATGCG